ncbi:MAG: hypothetical protein F4056_01955 [Chloroflexi bacterium]|nr:hypothetical protein [Chloroflexota bacterium]
MLWGYFSGSGFDRYRHLRVTAVVGIGALRHGRDAPAPPPPVSLDLPASAFIPERYIEDLEARIALYQRIAGLRDLREEADLCAEVSDRFGELPGPLRELLALVRIRLAAGEAGVAAVRAEGGEIVLVAREGAPFGRRGLPPLPAGVRVGQTQLRLPRAALGADWLDAIEALLRLIGEPHAATLRAPAGAVRA